MQPKTRVFTVWLLPFLALLLGWQLGVGYGIRLMRADDAGTAVAFTASGTVLGDPEDEVDLSLLWEAWRALQQHYIEPEKLQKSAMTYGIVEGMVRAVGDPYTVFMNPKEHSDFQEALEGNFEGIGAELRTQDGLIYVAAPLKNSPAERVGLMTDDLIIEINKESTQGLSLAQVISRIRGPKGTTVELTIFHEGKDTRSVVITREAIIVPSVESRIIENPKGKIGFVALNQYGSHSMAEMREVLEGFRRQSLKGIILDLRFNGGGYLDGAIELTSMFLREGDIVTVERREGPADTYTVTGRPLFGDMPLVVLINQASASASEITAGALQDHKRAKIVGMKSFGKGTVQDVLELPGGSSIRITTAHWLLPSGRNLAKEGVMPDITVDRTAEDITAERDPQLDAATAWLLEGKDLSQTSSSSRRGSSSSR